MIFFLNPKFQASVTVQSDLCRTCSETTLFVFSQDGSSICKLDLLLIITAAILFGKIISVATQQSTSKSNWHAFCKGVK